MIRRFIRYCCRSGLLGFRYPANFPIKTCLRWRMHRYERATLNYLRSVLQPGDVFLDVGAHVGYHAVCAARWVGKTGKVFAFEPHPDNHRVLVRNARHLPNLTPVQAAVSDVDGQALLFEHSASTTSHALTDLSGSGRSVPVRSVTLDEWTRERGIVRVNALLIDVEGHEFPVLRGMRRLLADNPGLKIVMEYCPSHNAARAGQADELLAEISRLSLRVTRALGQSREYALPSDASEAALARRLAAIVIEETGREGCDYVNLVVCPRA